MSGGNNVVDITATAASQLLNDLAELKPTGVAVILQLDSADGSGITTCSAGMMPANLQLGIRMMQLKADDEILEIVGGD